MVKQGIKIVFTLMLLVSAFSMSAQERVGVVLSGGGAKGLSHIGVLQALEENNIPIDYICGTSMGAVIASFYAIGLSPAEMLDIVTSEDFAAWCSGKQEKRYESRFYREDATPKMISIYLKRKSGKVDLSFPSSLVSPFPMDLAMMDAYASPSIAAGGDFANLMVPFFCVSSDVMSKKTVVHTSGDLGSAVRASMTYPLVFKPITIDSMVLFDGGFYDNFPWKEMERIHSPTLIIGAKCAGEDPPLDDEDIIGQITNMIVSHTDYNIPEDKGIVIGAKYDYGVMQFEKAREIVEQGYRVAKNHMEQISGRIDRRRSRRELDSMRFVFRKENKRILFAPQILFEGNLDSLQQEFVSGTIRGNDANIFDFNTLKQGYYKLASSGLFKTLHPSYVQREDSLLHLKLKGSTTSALELYMGGNISSSYNQGYAGIKLQHFGRRVWNLIADVNIGSHYMGAGVKWRHHVGLNPLLSYDFEAVIHNFSYPYRQIGNTEIYSRIGGAMQLGQKSGMLLKGNVNLGKMVLQYLPDNVYRIRQSRDRTELEVFSPSVGIGKNTFNYPLYPTEGTEFYVKAKWKYAVERYLPSDVSAGVYGKLPLGNRRSSIFGIKGHISSYIKLNERFILGYVAEISLQSGSGLYGYIPALLYMPAFSPFPVSSPMLLSGYRADTYAGIGISPVICVAKTLFLHTNISYFQPYRQIYEKQGGGYGYSRRFPAGAFMGNATIVWQSPVGPVSISAGYYQKGEQKRWYPQLDIGLLLFKKKMTED